MSVHERKRAGGKRVYQVTLRDQDGRQRAETYTDRRRAERRNAEIADLRWDERLHIVDAGTEPLRDAAAYEGMAADATEHHQDAVRHRGTDPIAAQLALQLDDASGIDVAQRDIPEAGE